MVAGIARIFFWGYTAMLLGVGASGVFVARWELTRVFSMPLVAGTTVAATMLNQYRFLKAMEFAFGVFCASYRREIFQRARANRVFLAGVFAGVFARLLGWSTDGTPSIAFVVFAALELITGLLVWATVWASTRTVT
jgi:hypothetical protein